MKDRKQTIAVLKDILKGEQPITALDEDKKEIHKINVYMEHDDGRLFKCGPENSEEEVSEEERKRIDSDPNVIRIGASRYEMPKHEKQYGTERQIYKIDGQDMIF